MWICCLRVWVERASHEMQEGTSLAWRRCWGWLNILPVQLHWTQQWSPKVYNGGHFNSLYSFCDFLLCITRVKRIPPQNDQLKSVALPLFSERKLLAPVDLFNSFLGGEGIPGYAELFQCFLFFPSPSEMPWCTYKCMRTQARAPTHMHAHVRAHTALN